MAIASEDDMKDGKPNWESVQRSKLRFDARRWYASKLSPKKYSDRMVQEVTGAEGSPLVPAVEITDVDRAHTIARLLTRARSENRFKDHDLELPAPPMPVDPV